MDLLALKEWFEEEKRILPWRENPSPYGVWISEVMLQQTQASVVVGYFERWMRRFPTLFSLAEAPWEEVIKLWEGLGYYSRVRHIYRAAQQLVAKNQGELPSLRKELEAIKGLGPYTVGAILSFAFHERAAAVDGNVARVLSRHFFIEEDIAKAKVKKNLHDLVLSLLPQEEPWVAMEALIELGAQICQKKPLCEKCPIQKSCLAYKRGKAHLLPVKKKHSPITLLTRYVPVLKFGEKLLLRKEKTGKVMADLYEFPYFEQEISCKEIQKIWGIQAVFRLKLSPVKHTFTRYRAELFPALWETTTLSSIEDCHWIEMEEAKTLAFSSGHRRIFHEVYAAFTH